MITKINVALGTVGVRFVYAYKYAENCHRVHIATSTSWSQIESWSWESGGREAISVYLEPTENSKNVRKGQDDKPTRIEFVLGGLGAELHARSDITAFGESGSDSVHIFIGLRPPTDEAEHDRLLEAAWEEP